MRRRQWKDSRVAVISVVIGTEGARERRRKQFQYPQKDLLMINHFSLLATILGCILHVYNKGTRL